MANRFLQVEGNPLVDEVLEMMPGSNCGQCGFPGCSGAAARRRGWFGRRHPVCPPGGKALASALAAKLGLSLDLSGMDDSGPKLAAVAEELCIGCCRCAKGVPHRRHRRRRRQIHNVLREACTGCESCVPVCPTEALLMKPMPVTLQHWVMPRPAAVA